MGGDLPATTGLPQFINADLREYQKHGVRWMAFLYQLRFGAVLADDMGLGKTLQTITFLAGLKESESGAAAPKIPHLAVLPPTLVFNWESEIKRFIPGSRSASTRATGVTQRKSMPPTSCSPPTTSSGETSPC